MKLAGPAALLLAFPFALDAADCGTCHRDIAARYAGTPMGRSFYSPGTIIEQWNTSFYHAPSDRHYQMRRSGSSLSIRRYQIDANGKQVHELELPVTHIVGSGTRARSYLSLTSEGRLIELPVAWYTQEQRWEMAPGYDRPNHPDFSRTVNHRCMFCHNAYPNVPAARARAGWDHDVRWTAPLPAGIDCERCHGRGDAHARSGGRQPIVNPARLSPERQLDVCRQCHLETTSFRLPESYRRFGRPFYSLQPGEPLADYMVHFDHPPGAGREDKFEIVSAAYRLQQAVCFRQSGGRLTCLTCHQVHAAQPPDYRARCLSCHSRPHDRGNCIDCHMPKRRSEDVVHVVMTDHKIERRASRGLTAPRTEKPEAEQIYRGPVAAYYPLEVERVYKGIAQVKERANLVYGLDMLEKAIAGPYPEPYYELAEAQAFVGRREQASDNYRMALARDPEFVQAEAHLANLLAAMGRPGEAIERYGRAIALDPGWPDLYVNLALTRLEVGDRQGATRDLLRATQADPLYAQAHRELGAVALLEGRIADAIRHLERALTIEPADLKASHNLSLAIAAARRQ